MALRETENNAYAKFLGDKQRALWYVMVFSGVVNTLVNTSLSIRRFWVKGGKMVAQARSIPKYWSSTPWFSLVTGSPHFSSWHTCAHLCTRGVCTGSLKWRVGEKGKIRCNNDIKHVVKKLTIAISNRNIDELRELAC